MACSGVWRGVAVRCAGGLLAGLLCVAAGAQTGSGKAKTGKPPAAGFTAQLVLTPDAAAFVSTWNAAKEPPRLDVTGSVQRGGTVSAMLLFSGCRADKAGKCDVVAAFTLQTPDGRRLDLSSGPVWNEAVPGGRLQLGQRGATLRFDNRDAAGVYKVSAVVTDRNARQSLEVDVPLTLN